MIQTVTFHYERLTPLILRMAASVMLYRLIFSGVLEPHLIIHNIHVRTMSVLSNSLEVCVSFSD